MVLHRTLLLLTFVAVFLGGLLSGQTQELEPRRWSHLPIGSNFLGGGVAYTEADIFVDPVLEVEAAELSMTTVALKVLHTFECLDRSARAEISLPFQDAEWSGLLRGEARKTSRTGLGDAVARFSINLYGAPPLSGEAFRDYRKRVYEGDTIIGAGLALHLPIGQYSGDKLLNLGSNRFTIRPQLGVVHNRGPWGFELTGSAWFYTDNEDFFGDVRREEDPYYAIQAHLVYTLRPGLWFAAGLGYGEGGASTVGGIAKNDRRANLAWAVSVGVPVHPRFGIKLGYVGTQTQQAIGFDSHSVVLGASLLW